MSRTWKKREALINLAIINYGPFRLPRLTKGSSRAGLKPIIPPLKGPAVAPPWPRRASRRRVVAASSGSVEAKQMCVHAGGLHEHFRALSP